uniref:aspartate-alanine antiporter-like transporter n=1 Tax=Halalkalibacter lacteus TaxID=3090663 RepID=UPI002FCBDAD9
VRLGHLGPLVWHMPASVNLAFRELGITLFLACVGLRAGRAVFDTVLTPQGLAWIGAAALVTMLPLLLGGTVARLALKLDYVTL